MRNLLYNKIKLFFIFVSLFAVSNLFGASQTATERAIDSLKECIASSSFDTVKINALISWDNLIYVSNPQLDLELNEKIVKLAEDNLKKESLQPKELYFYKKSLALALNSLGIIAYNKGESSKALDYYSKSLALRKDLNDKKGIAATLNNIGIVHQDQAENDKAIDFYTQGLRINEEIGDKNGEAICLSNIGRIYRELKDTVKSIDYQTKSLVIREKLGDKRGMAIAYSNLGSLYASIGDEIKAMDFFQRYLAVSREIGDKNKEAGALLSIGFIYKQRKDYKLALDYINQSLNILEEIGNNRLIAANLPHLGDIYKQQGDMTKALGYYQKALNIAKEGRFVSTIMENSQALYDVYKELGKYKEALTMQELYYQMRDSILNENNQKEVIQQEFKYNYEKQKAIDDKEHEKEMIISAEKGQRQKIAIYFGIGIILLITGFTIFALNRLRLTRKQNIIIHKQKSIVEEKQKEIMASFTYAKRLQDGILPSSQYIQSQLPQSFILYKPKDIVAGDFYWLERKNDLLLFAVADGTGHGIPGAIISVICSNALNTAVLEFGITEPGKILDKARELVLENFSKSGTDVKDGMDISLLSINFKTKEIKWSGANNPLWYVSDGQLKEIKANKQPIGKTDNPLPFTTHSINYSEGDTFYLFTDGYADQFGGSKGKKLMYKTFKNLLLENATKPLHEQKAKLEEAFDQWQGNLEQVDDVCLVGIKI